MRILELFSGTGSVGEVAMAMNHSVVSVDNNSKFVCTHNVDIMRLDHTSLPVPDFVWASPPCTTYSFAAIWYRHRDSEGRALTEAAKEGDRLLHRTLEIIHFFLEKNPKLLFCIENPRGYMKKQECLQGFVRTTTSYNQYGFPVYKPTDLFTNFHLDVTGPRKKSDDLRICGGNAIKIRERLNNTTNTNLSILLGRIPPALVRSILCQAETHLS